MNKQRGRKPLSGSGSKRVVVYLTDELYEFVRAQTASASEVVRKAMEREFRRKRGVERERKGA